MVQRSLRGEEATHQPFLLDSSWTFTCQPKSQQQVGRKCGEIVSALWDFFFFATTLQCSSRSYILLPVGAVLKMSTYPPVLARGPPAV